MADATGIRAGGLYWDIEVKQANQALAKVRAVGKELDKALNSGRDRVSGMSRLAKEASDASKDVARLAEQFTLLNSRYKLGKVDAAEYASRLERLGKGLKWAGDQAGLSAKDYAALATTTTKVAAEQSKLATASAKVVTEQGKTAAAANASAAAAEKQRAASVAQTNAARKQAQALAFLAQNTTDVSARVGRISDTFTRLKSSFDLGQIEAREYAARLADLSTGIQRTGNMAGLSTRELKTLSSTFNAVTRAQQSLGTGTQSVNQRVAELVNQTRLLRNTWQTTGKATTETKDKLKALVVQMEKMKQELLAGENGWKRYNPQITRLGVSMRSATATVAGMEGRMSRLGLASQVNLALTNQLTASLYRLGPAGAVAGQGLGLVAGSMGSLGAGSLIAGGGITALALSAVALSRRGTPLVEDFTEALAFLNANGAEFTDLQLDDALRRAAIAAGFAGTQFNRAQMATALKELVKAGLDTADAMNLLAPSMQVASISQSGLSETSSLLLQNLRQFRLETTEAARAADALAAADNEASSTAADLSKGMSTVGPLARAAGFEFEDLLGILVELDNAGLEAADRGATALRTTLAGLLDPSAEAKTVLDNLGVSLKNADGSSRPLLTVLQELQKALEGSGEAAQAAAMIFDTRAVTAILAMSEKSTELAEALKNSAGFAKAYADQLQEGNLKRANQELKTAIDNLALSFTLQLNPGILQSTQFLAEFVTALESVASQAPKTRGALDRFLSGVPIIGPLAVTLRRQFGEDPTEPPLPAVPGGDGSGGGGGGGGGGGNAGGRAATRTFDELIAKARELKAAWDNATDPKAWLTARDAVSAFRTSSDEAASAWDAVVATTKRAAEQAKSDARTVQNIFDDLAKTGKQSERAADALGNTSTARAQSLTDRLKATQTALNEMLARPDVNTQENKDKVSYLLARAAELEAELVIVQKGIDDVTAAQARLITAGEEARDRTVASMREATRQGLIKTAERERIEALTATPQEIEAAKEAAARIGASMAEATERGRQQTEARLLRTRQARGRAAAVGIFPLLGDENDIFSDSQIASIESAVRIITSLNEATDLGVAATARRAEAEHRLRLEILERERISAKLVRIEEAQNALDAVRIERQKQAELARVRGSASSGAASLGAILTPENQAGVEAGIRIINSLAEATDRGTEATKKRREAEAKLQQALERRNDIVGQMTSATERDLQATEDSNNSVERLQRRILNLIKLGYDPASDAVKRLERRINELNLQLALQELRTKGAANLSEFAKEVLKANGVFAETAETTSTLLERLEALGGTSGGLAQFVRGLKEATAEGASTADIIGGVTTAVDGLNEALQGTASAADLVKSLGSGIAEIIGTHEGLPGLGGLFGAVFELGATIASGISDAFTGDSPAARAIRDVLTPAITNAFTTGIINGIRGADGWQDDLKDSIKTVFLQSLIQAFVNGAIIQTILQPVIDRYSRLIAQGNVQAATEYLKTALPAALDTAVSAAEGFVASIPPGYLDPATATGGAAQDPNRPSTFRLPDALPAGSSAAVSNFGAYVGGFGKSVGSFGEWVRSLQQQGITVNVSGARSGGGSGSPQAARTA